MKKTIVTILVSTAMILSGCSVFHSHPFGIFGKSSAAEDRAKSKVDAVYSDINSTKDNRLDLIGTLSLGTDHALSKEKNPSRAVITAEELNSRVEALANKPSLKESEAVKALADLLITNSIAGEKALAVADKQIESLQNTIVQLNSDKETALKKYMQQADKAASLADKDAAQLSKMNSFFGLGAVFYGLHRLVVSSLWFIGIGSVVFLILRFASLSNPLAATIFGVGEHLMSYVIKVIVAFFPKCLSYIQKAEQTVVSTVEPIVTKIETYVSGSIK